MECGRERLSDAELVALLIATGTQRANALTVARQLLRKHPLTALPGLSIEQLTNTAGIGKAKAVRIVAALELGERVFSPARVSRKIIATTDDILVHVGDISEKKQEHLVVLYINARKEIIGKEVVGVGNLNTALIEPKEIFAFALMHPCAAIILAHNHPSGDAAPSAADVRFTDRIRRAGELLGILLLDHVIVSRDGYFSFAQPR